MSGFGQLDLMPLEAGAVLPRDYGPCPPALFIVDHIVLCKGSLSTPEREAFVRRICDIYPHVPVDERLATPHNRIELGESDALHRVSKGKRTLVFGELGLKSAVWENELRNAVFTNEMCFSVYGFCPYACAYCYLNGTPGIRHSPTVKIFVNLPEILGSIQRKATSTGHTITFYLGRYQDGLALDSLSAYSAVLIPFFARQPFARQVIQTKSAHIQRLLNLDHQKHTTLSWTLTPPSIANVYESCAPPVEARIQAMQACAAAGYPLQASIAPIIPCPDWEQIYADFIRDVAKSVALERFILSGVCMDRYSLEVLERRLGTENAISRHLARRPQEECDRVFYTNGLCDRLISRATHELREIGDVKVTDDRRQGLSVIFEFRNNKVNSKRR